MRVLSPEGCLGFPRACGQEGSRLHPAAMGIQFRSKEVSLITGRHSGGGVDLGAMSCWGLLKSPSMTRGTVYGTEREAGFSLSYRKPGLGKSPMRLRIMGENARHKHLAKVWEDGMRQNSLNSR